MIRELAIDDDFWVPTLQRRCESRPVEMAVWIPVGS